MQKSNETLARPLPLPPSVSPDEMVKAPINLQLVFYDDGKEK